MSIYKGITVPAKLDGIIGHMADLERSREEISILGQQWDLLTILGQITGSGTNMSGTRESFRSLTEQLLGTLGLETLKKTTQTLSGQAQVAVDIVIRNLFERTADIGFLATDEDIRKFLRPSATGEPKTAQEVQNLRERFLEYVAKYSVYENIVLLDPQGNVLCSMKEDLTTTRSSDPMIQEAQTTDKVYLESFAKSDLNPSDKKTLLYGFRVTESNEKSSQVLGVLCLIFRFKDELEMVFKNLVDPNEWGVLTLLDASGRVIASSDESQIPLESKVPFEANKEFHVGKFGGRLYLSKTCPTKGYQGYTGLGWFGHCMIPVEHAFRSQAQTENTVSENVIQAVTENEVLFSRELRGFFVAL
jgi:hypothetical protein